jgi:hypothetical protein
MVRASTLTKLSFVIFDAQLQYFQVFHDGALSDNKRVGVKSYELTTKQHGNHGVVAVAFSLLDSLKERLNS